jgi:glycosyltransferase involved in cell wall biosynthesis
LVTQVSTSTESKSTRCRVIHVASGREWRGGQRQVLLLAAGLAIHPEVETSVVTGAGTTLAERLEAAGVRVHPVSWTMGLDPRVVAALLGELAPDVVVHAHDSHAHALADAAIRIRSGHLVVTRRVDFPIRRAGHWRRVDRAIALSGPVRERLLAAEVPAERITVIPPAVDLAALEELPPWPAAVPMRRDQTPFIVSVAALTPEKGVDVLLEAAAHLRATHPAIDWIVLGDGPQRDRLLARRKALGLEERVAFPGHVDHPEAVVARARVMVQPSRSEGFGSTVLEALGLGVPVVASQVGGLPESLAAGGGLLVSSGDPGALAQAVARILGDPALHKRLSGDGRAAAEGFSVSRLVSRTLDVYRSLAMNPADR